MKRVLSLFVCVTILMTAFTACGDSDSSGSSVGTKKDNGEMRDITSTELVKEMGLGWNLGNTFDSCQADRDGDGTVNETAKDGNEPDETLWGNPKTTKKLFENLKNDGFKSVRIPITWRDHTGAGPDFKITDNFMDRVEEVVNYALSCDMYVIINMHHDGGTDTEQGAWILNAATDYDGVLARFKAIWTQIAERFKGYSDKLLFEDLNEVGFDSLDAKEGKVILQNLNQEFVNLIRKSGGNNDKRHLLVGGYWTDIAESCKDFSMPKDDSNRCILSVHYYTPSEFCIFGNNKEWGTEAEIKELNSKFKLLKTNYIDKGIPVIIGEYGCVKGVEESSYVYWCESVAKQCSDLGIASFFWDNGEVYNRNEYKWTIEKLVGALNKATSGENYTPEIDKSTDLDTPDLSNPKIIMPNLVGQDIDKVVEIYNDYLDITSTEKNSDNKKVGVILEQSIIEGSITEKGASLLLTISSGK